MKGSKGMGGCGAPKTNGKGKYAGKKGKTPAPKVK